MDMEQIIREKLVEIENKENVRIIMAVESGSRAWGFASPDSDYDVRFVYVRNLEDYLKLEKTRDVIEWQLDDTLDISDWDLKKALQLMHESNPSIFEWCASSIVLQVQSGIRGTAGNQERVLFQKEEPVPLLAHGEQYL